MSGRERCPPMRQCLGGVFGLVVELLHNIEHFSLFMFFDHVGSDVFAHQFELSLKLGDGLIRFL